MQQWQEVRAVSCLACGKGTFSCFVLIIFFCTLLVRGGEEQRQRCAVFLFASKDFRAVPFLHYHAQAVADDLPSTVCLLLRRQLLCQFLRHGCVEKETQEAAEARQVGQGVALSLLGGEFGVMSETSPRLVHCLDHGGACSVLFEQIVHLCKGSGEVQSRVGGQCVQDAFEERVGSSIDLLRVWRRFQCRLCGAKEVIGIFWSKPLFDGAGEWH